MHWFVWYKIWPPPPCNIYNVLFPPPLDSIFSNTTTYIYEYQKQIILLSLCVFRLWERTSRWIFVISYYFIFVIISHLKTAIFYSKNYVLFWLTSSPLQSFDWPPSPSLDYIICERFLWVNSQGKSVKLKRRVEMNLLLWSWTSSWSFLLRSSALLNTFFGKCPAKRTTSNLLIQYLYGL